MPNHVTSVITLSGDESRIKTMLEAISKELLSTDRTGKLSLRMLFD